MAHRHEAATATTRVRVDIPPETEVHVRADIQQAVDHAPRVDSVAEARVAVVVAAAVAGDNLRI